MTFQYPPMSAQPQPRSSKPGTIPLRPLGAGDILGGAFATLRANWLVMLGVPFVAGLIISGVRLLGTPNIQAQLQEALRNAQGNPTQAAAQVSELMPALLRTMGLTVLAVVLVNALVLGMLATAASRAVIGQRVSVAEALRTALPRYLPLLLLFLVFAVIGAVVYLGPSLVFSMVASGSPAQAALAAVGLGVPVGVLLLVWLTVTYMFAPIELIMAPQPLGKALTRSRWLVRGAWWRTFGILVVGGLITVLMTLVVSLPLGLIQVGSTMDAALHQDFKAVLAAQSSPTMIVVSLLVSAVSSALMSGFMVSVVVLLYHDQRIRRERFDIPLAKAAGLTPPA